MNPGTHLGPYEVTAQIGVGGMGEVYRALDTDLERQVAIKILPDTFAHDPERLARFEREARTLASMNHPNIAQIYGLEKADGIRALVMELAEGPTLAERIAQGPIPVDDALAIAKQIAEALEAAHELGIIHRDLKPANVKVRPDGMVKVLDFGLAKAMHGDAMHDAAAAIEDTRTSPAVTRLGVILGTAAYMAPEQARGKAIDRRVDIWAFGCVLYEILTGRRPFAGDTITDVLSAIVSAEPDWSALPMAAGPFTVGALASPDSYDNSNIDAVLLATGERRVVVTGAAMARSRAGAGPVRWRLRHRHRIGPELRCESHDGPFPSRQAGRRGVIAAFRSIRAELGL